MGDTPPGTSTVEKGLAVAPEREEAAESSIQEAHSVQITPHSAENTTSTAGIETTSRSNTDTDATIENKPPNAEHLRALTDEPPSERPIERVVTIGEDYSILTTSQKKLVILTASIAAIFSPMATSIYCEFYVGGNLEDRRTHAFRSITSNNCERS